MKTMVVATNRPKVSSYLATQPKLASQQSAMASTAPLARYIVLRKVEGFGKVLSLKQPLIAEIATDGQYFFAESKDLELSAHADSEQGARQAIAEAFLMTWDGLKAELDSALSLDAQYLRDRFSDFIETDCNA